MAQMLVTAVQGDASSIALVTGRPLLDDGELQYPDDDTILTTIGADAGMAWYIAEALQAFINDPDENEQPVADFEPWSVLA